MDHMEWNYLYYNIYHIFIEQIDIELELEPHVICAIFINKQIISNIYINAYYMYMYIVYRYLNMYYIYTEFKFNNN